MATQQDIINIKQRIAGIRAQIAILRMAQEDADHAPAEMPQLPKGMELQSAHQPFQAQAQPEGPSRLKQEMQAGAGLLAGMVMPPFDPNQPDRDTPKLLGSETLAGAVNMVPASAQAVADIFSVANPMSPDYGMALNRLKNKPIVQTAAELAMALGMASGAAGGVAGIAKRIKSAPIPPRPAVSPTVAKPATVEPVPTDIGTQRTAIESAAVAPKEPFRIQTTGMGAKKVPEKPSFPVQENRPVQESGFEMTLHRGGKIRSANAVGTDAGYYGEGIYFSESPETATAYARRQGGGVSTSKVSLKKPLVVDWTTPELADKTATELARLGVERSGYGTFSRPVDATATLKSAGYDGVVVKRPNEPLEVVAFDASSVTTPRPTPDISQPIKERVGVEPPAVQGAKSAKGKEPWEMTRGVAESSIKKRGIRGDALLDAMDLADELAQKNAEIGQDGFVTVYHRTTPKNAEQIAKTGRMTSKEDRLFFGTHPEGQIEGYGDAVIKTRLPIEKLELNDVFSGEAHVTLKGTSAVVKAEVWKPQPAAKYAKPQSASPAVGAKEVAPPKPPVETPKPVAEAEPQGKYVSLKKAEGAEIRKRMRLDELDPVERQTFEDTWDRVAKEGKAEDALNIARDVIENGRQNKVMDDHTALFQKSIEIERSMDEAGRNLTEAAKRGDDATVTSEMARILNLNEEMDLVTRASDALGTEAGRGLSVRRMRADKESLSLAHVLQTARSNKGKALSPAEVVEFESSVKRIKDLEVENTKLVEDNSRIAAERDKAVAERVRRAEGQRVADPAKKAALREKLAAERADLEKKLAAMGNQMNAVVGPPTEAMHILGKLAANYIKEGAVSLEDVVGQIKKKFPNVADRDVWEALQARSPEAQRAAKKVVERNLSEFKKQARLLTEIDNLERGISEKPTSPLSKAQEAARTKELRKRLSELRKSLYESSLPADRLEASLTTLNDLQNHLANKTRPPKRGAPEIPAEVKPIKEQIAVLRRQMKAEDVLADLQEQLKTGEFKVEAKKKPFVTPELERNQILINQARRQLREALEAKKPMTMGRRAGAVVSGLREVAATADVSGTLRQGLVLTARRLFSDPIGLAKRNSDAWRSMLNKYKDEQIHNALKNDPQYADAVGDGLRLTEKGGEELYHSPLVEKIPGFGKVAQMSERHMRTYLNVMRWDAYKKFREAAPNATKAERQAIARSLNVMSGYGDLRTAPQALSVMSKVFFAPRFAVSRFQTPKLILDYWKEPRVRKEIAKNYAATAAFGASILAMAKMMGGEVGDDPRSADFGKVRFGDSRYDLWGGFQQPMRLLFRLGMVGTDRIGLTGTDLKDYEKDTDPFDLVSQFAVYKLAPHVTLPVELVRGKTVIGEKTTPVETIARSVVPFMLRDIREAYKQEGVGPAVTTGLVSAFGGGVGTYPDSETATRIKARRLVAENKTKEAQQILAEWNRNNPKNRITNP